ncbi:hypothetical protein BB14905_22653 [Bacillus sp. B14905]|nr:hypothetical protein BB14905_22653 [Bacillus sp. B14905]
MKLKHFLAIPIALIGLTYFTPQEASANTIDTSDTSVNTIISSDANIIDTSDEFLAKVKVYDANGEQFLIQLKNYNKCSHISLMILLLMLKKI